MYALWVWMRDLYFNLDFLTSGWKTGFSALSGNLVPYLPAMKIYFFSFSPLNYK
jgi:hypothetical protein